MAQLSKKFIKDDAVGAAKIRLENNAYLKSRNAADSANIDMFKVNASNRIEAGSVPQVTADAAAGNDLVRYSQIVTLFENEKPKAAVATVALANVNLASGADQSSQGGHTITDGQRVLLANQTAPAENGIYIATTAIDAQTWVRSADFNAVAEIPGAWTAVQFGTDAGKVYITTSNPVTLGTDPILFIKEAASATITQEVQRIDLAAGDITNQYVDLSYPALGSSAAINSVSLKVIGAGAQDKTVDYSVSLTGGAAGVTRITFLGDLATAGASALDASDFLEVSYSRI